MRLCIASTGNGHEATVKLGELWYCVEHGTRFLDLDTPPKNLGRIVKRLRRIRNPHRRAKAMRRLSEKEQIWVSKRIAGG